MSRTYLRLKKLQLDETEMTDMSIYLIHCLHSVKYMIPRPQMRSEANEKQARSTLEWKCCWAWHCDAAVVTWRYSAGV